MLDDLYHLLDPVAFQIGPFAVRWYGIGYIIGILLGLLIVYRTARRWRAPLAPDTLLTLVIAATLGIVIGGRLGYVLFYDLGRYLANPLEIAAFSNGGMSFHGGVLGMVVALVIVARLTRVPLLTIGDLVVVAAPLGIFLVRIANFINGELWGAPTDLPWGVVFDGAGPEPRHPTQLYEALLEGALLFVILQLAARRKPPLPRGSYVGIFMVCYGVFRIAVEFVRLPDAQLGYLLGTGLLTMGMVLSAPLVVAGACFLLYAGIRRLPQQAARSRLAKEE
ncbi:MAG: prolipoprotein diacylglyceryl transferase [Coriobacteriales bacterium]|jgi:phosphatidylglycerol:prolipoprotein diacylglycerol transferase|nr:prolipoprotein diacylglyceryl transferase [Coriobacteriales bacterium]